MPLTPADVHNVAFKKPPIGKRGYDEEEVDAFLDEVERELARAVIARRSRPGVDKRVVNVHDVSVPSGTSRPRPRCTQGRGVMTCDEPPLVTTIGAGRRWCGARRRPRGLCAAQSRRGQRRADHPRR